MGHKVYILNITYIVGSYKYRLKLCFNEVCKKFDISAHASDW